MTALGKGEKAAQIRALNAARAALKGVGASEIGGAATRRTRTASTKAVHHAHNAGMRLRKVRLRKIRVRA